MRQLPLKRIHREVRRLDPNATGENYDCAVMMLAATQVGTSIRALMAYTGLPRAFVAPRVERLRANGVFTRDGRITSDWFKRGGEGVIAFFLDVNVAHGLMQRAPAKENS